MLVKISISDYKTPPTHAATDTRKPLARNSSRIGLKSCASCRSASPNTPLMHQKTMSHAGASRPRNESSSIPSGALQQRRFADTTGEGQNTDRISSVMKPAEARRRLPSIDIEPLSDHLHLIDSSIAAQRCRDLRRMHAARCDHHCVSDVAGIDVANALQLARKIVSAPQIRTTVERDLLRRDMLLLDRRDQSLG